MQSYALPGSTARQLFNSSTLLDSSTHDSSTRQISTELDSAPPVLDTPAHAVSLDLPRRARQLLDSYSKGSTGKALTAPRDSGLDSGVDGRPGDSACVCRRLDTRREPSTARQPGLKMRAGYPRRERCRGRWYMVIKVARRTSYRFERLAAARFLSELTTPRNRAASRRTVTIRD